MNKVPLYKHKIAVEKYHYAGKFYILGEFHFEMFSGPRKISIWVSKKKKNKTIFVGNFKIAIRSGRVP